MLMVPLNDDQPDQVDIPFLGIALDIEVDAGPPRKRRRPGNDVDSMVSNRQGTQCVIAVGSQALRGSALPPWAKGMGELRDRQDALPGVSVDLLLAHPSKEADVVFLHRLVVAPLAELADLAVVVQDQFRWRLGIDQLLHFSKQTFGLPQITV